MPGKDKNHFFTGWISRVRDYAGIFCTLVTSNRLSCMTLPQTTALRRKPILYLGSLCLFASMIGWALSCRQAPAEAMPEKVDFNFHIRPILSDRCFKCHGPDAGTREAGLRLDTEEGAFAALKDDPGRHVIVRGDPMRSELYLRVSSDDTSFLMPPPASNLVLSPHEIRLIREWIRQGAGYRKHWAFIPPQKTQLP